MLDRSRVRHEPISAAWRSSRSSPSQASRAAQTFPDKPLRFVIPFAAGGGSDVMARVIAEPLAQRLGQPVVVDNKPGGNATIGADFVAKSPPDGYTWLHTSPGPQITNPYLMAKLPYDPVKDLTPVARLGTFISVLVVNPEVPAKTVKELVEYAKANPRKLNFASPGIASGGHLATEYFKTVAGIDLVHVPYKGTGAAIQDLISGNVQMSIDSMAALLPHIKSGQLRALAVAYSGARAVAARRADHRRDLSRLRRSPMNYLSVRGGTPKPLVDRLNAEVNAVLAMPAIKQKLLDMGVIATPSTPEEIAKQVESERVKWKKVIEDVRGQGRVEVACPSPTPPIAPSSTTAASRCAAIVATTACYEIDGRVTDVKTESMRRMDGGREVTARHAHSRHVGAPGGRRGSPRARHRCRHRRQPLRHLPRGGRADARDRRRTHQGRLEHHGQVEARRRQGLHASHGDPDPARDCRVPDADQHRA